jgi:hypothetical protein
MYDQNVLNLLLFVCNRSWTGTVTLNKNKLKVNCSDKVLMTQKEECLF